MIWLYCLDVGMLDCLECEAEKKHHNHVLNRSLRKDVNQREVDSLICQMRGVTWLISALKVDAAGDEIVHATHDKAY